MPQSERFGSGLRIVVGVLATTVSGITTITVNDVQVRRSNIQPERNVTAEVLVDSDTLDFIIEFQDDTLEHRTIVGKAKELHEPDDLI